LETQFFWLDLSFMDMSEDLWVRNSFCKLHDSNFLENPSSNRPHESKVPSILTDLSVGSRSKNPLADTIGLGDGFI
jgi:hypothetical protein